MIRENYERIRRELPDYVTIVAAAKSRTAAEVREVIEAGAEIIGENYVQEAERKFREIGNRVRWHMIGHLQRNKVKKALQIFDCIQTVDSVRLAREIDKRATRVVPVFIEVNIGGEETKFGVPPEGVLDLIQEISILQNIRVEGLMTMEPYFEDPERARPYFKRMRRLFEEIKAQNIPGVEMKVLSMGMTNSYRVAVEEGSNMVRIGTAIFGPR